MIKEHKELIDKWLSILNKEGEEFYFKEIFKRETGTNDNNYKEYNYALIHALLFNKDLVNRNPQGTFDTSDKLTSLGKAIAEAGGWDVYFAKQTELQYILEEDRRFTRMVAESTIKLNEKTQRIYAFQKSMTWVTLIVAAAAAAATVMQAYIMYYRK